MLTDDLVTRPSLWRDILEGKMGWVSKLVLALASGIFVAGVCLVVTFLLAAAVPTWNRGVYYYSNMPGGQPVLRAVNSAVVPRDEVYAMTFIPGGALWLVGVVWLFFRRSRGRAFLYPSLFTIGVIAACVFLGIVIDSSFRGDKEIMIIGACLIGAASILVIWLQAFRNVERHRPLYNQGDQLPDVRCPECGYRMVGLHESRCPECGRQYTLDELLGRQNFAPRREIATPIEPPPLPAHPASTA